MSCETIKVQTMDERQRGNPEVSYVSIAGKAETRYILGLRLYLDGAYPDPPPGVLPPPPQIRTTYDDDCCTIL